MDNINLTQQLAQAKSIAYMRISPRIILKPAKSPNSIFPELSDRFPSPIFINIASRCMKSINDYLMAADIDIKYFIV